MNSESEQATAIFSTYVKHKHYHARAALKLPFIASSTNFNPNYSQEL